MIKRAIKDRNIWPQFLLIFMALVKIYSLPCLVVLLTGVYGASIMGKSSQFSWHLARGSVIMPPCRYTIPFNQADACILRTPASKERA
jgi:hypothetical protein